MKLLAIAVPTIVRDLMPQIPRVIEAGGNVAAVKGWCAVLRGPAVFFVSPPGWDPITRTVLEGSIATDERCAIECARTGCATLWGGIANNADLDGAMKHESPSFGPSVEEAIAKIAPEAARADGKAVSR